MYEIRERFIPSPIYLLVSFKMKKESTQCFFLILKILLDVMILKMFCVVRCFPGALAQLTTGILLLHDLLLCLLKLPT